MIGATYGLQVSPCHISMYYYCRYGLTHLSGINLYPQTGIYAYRLDACLHSRFSCLVRLSTDLFILVDG